MPGHNAATNLSNADKAIADPGASGTINVDRCPCVVDVVTAAAEGRTLAAPMKSGLIVTVGLKSDGGDLTLTVTGGMNQSGNSSAVAADAGDALTLVSIAVGTGFKWRVLANDGFSLS